jgi:hypothetical protein
MFSPAKLLALSNRLYCLLLYLYPTPFRREYGTHMAQVFRDDVRGILQDSGILAVMGLWPLAFFDLLKTAVLLPIVTWLTMLGDGRSRQQLIPP